MHAYLKQSTATQTRVIGPFVDDTDFKTAETALSIANTDVKLSKNGGTAANKNSGGGTHIANGMYALTFDATDTNTVGELSGSISMTGALVVPFKFTVLEEAIYDALFGASAAGFDANGRVDVAKIAGTTQTARDIGASVLLSSGTGTGQLSLSSGLVTVGTNNDKTGYSISGTKTTLDALNDIDGTGLATSAGLATVDLNVDAIKAKTDQFVFTVANQVDANALSGGGGLDASGVRAAVGLASANLDTQLGDIPTVSEFNARTLLASAYFDASTDTVNLAADQSGVTIGMVNAMAGTITTLDALDTAQDSQHATTQSAISGLNDIAATDIVSNGAITTLAGAVVNVDTVDTCTTNIDMRGTDGANTTAPDNASIAAILTDTGTTIPATLGTPTGSDLATDIANISAGSAPTAAQVADAVWTEAIADHSGTVGSTAESLSNASAPTAGAVADAVWDEAMSGHVSAGSFGYWFSGITRLASWLGIIAGKTADASTLAEVNATAAGANYDNTRESQEAIRDRGDSAWTTGSVSGNVTITPLAAGVEQRVSGTTISLYTEEVKATTISISDSAGSAVDLSGLTLELAIEDHAGTDVQVIADGSIARSGASNENATFTNSSAVTSTERVLRWSLRDITTGNEVLARGNIVVTRAGAED